jgi:hypothetical protein
MNKEDLSASICAWDDYSYVDVRGSETSMGPNG